MGHWEQCPHTPGMEGHCLITLGGTQTPQRPHSALPTPCIRRFELRFGCHTVVWTPSSNHLQQLGSPWGMGAMPPHPRDGRTLLAHLGGAHTHHHNHIRRCRHRIRRYRITVWVRFGCCMVVCTSSSACRVTMGHWGQCHHIPEMARHCLATLGGHTHTSTTTFGVADAPYSTVGSNCAAPCSGVKRWCACHPQHVGSPWGNGGNVTTSQGWQGTAWSPWVGGTHTPYSTVGSNCAAPFGCRTVACTSYSAARAAMGHCPT